ncbi:MAG: hypothetical protein D6702_07745 [Planctomycetota bacterium]|nr:MAG: hypothetical protein D6702_07745 [Planctomycetota bacterium]
MPLDLRLLGRAVSGLLRSPGRERDLIAGFLAVEGVLEHPEDLVAVEPCRGPEGEKLADVWHVASAAGASPRPIAGDRSWSVPPAASAGSAAEKS